MSRSERMGQEVDYNFGSTFSLTSIINSQHSTPRSIARTLLDFFNQRIQIAQDIAVSSEHRSQASGSEDFNTYLNEISHDLVQIKRKATRRFEESIAESMDLQDIVKCYNDIPYIFFEKDFVLNMENYGNKQKMRQEQEELNEYLDLVEINLFTQVNHKFNDFYQALVNFEELEHKVEDNICRLAIVRARIPVIKKKFLQKAASVSKIIQLRTNKEVVLRHLTVMRSLRKLPPTIKTILQSPLPHESLSLLSTGKSMYQIVKRVQSLRSIGESLEKSDNVIKHSLYKSFSDKIFLYVTAPLNPPYIKQFESVFSSQAQTLNSSLFEEPLIQQSQYRAEASTNPNTEAELVATIVESYQLVDFVGESRIRSKIIQHIKLITREFFDQLKGFLSKYLKSEAFLKEQSVQQIERGPTENLSDLLDKLNMGCFWKLVCIYQNMLKDTTSRILSIAQQLYFKFSQDPHINTERCVPVIGQLLSILNSVLKIVCDETSQYLAMKKLSKQTTIYEFSTYLNPLTSWIKYCQSILQSAIFAQKSTLSGFQTQEYKNKVLQIAAPLRQNKQKLQDAYITNLHMGVISSQLKYELEKETWVSVEDIPFSYLTILNYIFNKNDATTHLNISINKDPNSSFNEALVEGISRRERNRAFGQSINLGYKSEQRKQIYDIKLLKNGIVLDKKRYKTTVSFLLFCEVLEEYLKIQEIFPEKKTEMTLRIADIATYFSSYSTQLIVWAGALKFNAIKSRNITVKHLCLLWCNLKLLWEMLSAQQSTELKKIINQVHTHMHDVIKKMSSIIYNKVESQLQNLYKKGLTGSAPTEPTLSIINSQRQMIEIMEQYLEEGVIKEVMARSVNMILKKYFEFLQNKGERGAEEGKYYIEEMKVLEISFEKEMELMKKILKL